MILFKENIEEAEDIARIGYKNAYPFPHVYIDNFFNHDFLNSVISDVKKLNEHTWWEYDNIFEKKYAYNNFQNMGKQVINTEIIKLEKIKK